MFYVLFILLCVAIAFLYITALSGIKFYETRLQREDVKNIKWSIHVAMLVVAVCLGTLFYKGNLNDTSNQEVVSSEKIEKVETKKPTE